MRIVLCFGGAKSGPLWQPFRTGRVPITPPKALVKVLTSAGPLWTDRQVAPPTRLARAFPPWIARPDPDDPSDGCTVAPDREV